MDSNTVLDLVLLSEVGQLRAAKADLAVLLAGSDVEEIRAAAGAGQHSDGAGVGAQLGGAVRLAGALAGPAGASGRVLAQAILAAIDADRAAQADGA